MGRIFVVELEGRAYKCKFCDTHLALADDLVSKAFNCHRGKAYLFNSAENVIVGENEERMMLSGLHTVADVFCCFCGQIVGWKYETAHERSQKYKGNLYSKGIGLSMGSGQNCSSVQILDVVTRMTLKFKSLISSNAAVQELCKCNV